MFPLVLWQTQDRVGIRFAIFAHFYNKSVLILWFCHCIGDAKKQFENALQSEYYKVIECSRGVRGIPTRGRNGNLTESVTGGGVAIVYNEENFIVEEAGIEAPEGIEAVWIILTPKFPNPVVKKILVGGIYIAPRSLYKQKTIDHIMETMFYVQSKYE